MIKNRFTRLLAIAALALPLNAFASSHQEAPLISEDPTADNTDVYAFKSPDNPGTITIIANYNPLEEPSNGPNFFGFSDPALYEINIDNNGDGKEDITYQFRFRTERRNLNTFLYNTGQVLTLSDPNLNVRQFYTVNRVTGGRRTGGSTEMGNNFQTGPANVGPKSMPDYASLANAAVFPLGTGGKVFAGSRDDPFFVDIGAIADLLTLRPIQQLHLVPPVSPSAAGVDGLRGFNILTIAIQVPIASLVSGSAAPAAPTDANAVIGVWATASRPRLTLLNTTAPRRTTLSGFSQVSRLGMPLVNEVITSFQFKDIFNASEPSGDKALFDGNADFRNRILDPEVPKLYKALYNLNVPPAPRNDLVMVYLTGLPGKNQPPNVVASEMLRLNVAVPLTASGSISRFGVLANDLGGFPNGRRLADDVVDITLRVAAGVLVPGFDVAPNNVLTDGVDANDKAFLSTFPYVPLPTAGFDSRPHTTTGPNP